MARLPLQEAFELLRQMVPDSNDFRGMAQVRSYVDLLIADNAHFWELRSGTEGVARLQELWRHGLELAGQEDVSLDMHVFGSHYLGYNLWLSDVDFIARIVSKNPWKERGVEDSKSKSTGDHSRQTVAKHAGAGGFIWAISCRGQLRL